MSNELTKLERVALSRLNMPGSTISYRESFIEAQAFLDASPDRGKDLAKEQLTGFKGVNEAQKQSPVSDLVWQALEACDKLIKRMQEVYENSQYQSVWHCYQIHGGDYTNGPKWGSEESEANDLVAKALATKSSRVAARSVPEGVIEKLNAIKSTCTSEPVIGWKGNIWNECDDALKLCESSTTPDPKPCVPKEVVDILHIIGQETLNYRIKTLAEKALTLCATPYVDPRVKELEREITMLNAPVEGSYITIGERDVRVKELYEKYIQTFTKLCFAEQKIKQLETQLKEAFENAVRVVAMNKKLEGALDIETHKFLELEERESKLEVEFVKSINVREAKIKQLERQRDEAVKTLENLIAYPQVPENRIVALLKNLKGDAN